MSICASIALCFIPLLALYICFLLLVRGFSKLQGLLACLYGLLSLIPIEAILILISFFMPSKRTGPALTLLRMIIINGVIEEGAKAAFLFLLPAKKTEKGTFLVYSLLCGLSLGCLETLIYFINGNRSVEIRIFTAVAIHTLCAALSGIFVYSAKHKNAKIITFLFAILFHGVYNYFASLDAPLHYFSYAVIVIAALECKLRFSSVKIKKQNGDTDMSEKKSLFGKFKNLFAKKDEAKEEIPEQSTPETEDKTIVDADQAEEAAKVEAETEAEVEVEPTFVSEEKNESNIELSPEQEKEVASFVEDMPKVVDLFEEDGSDSKNDEEIIESEESDEEIDTVSESEVKVVLEPKVEEAEKEEKPKKKTTNKASTAKKTSASKTATKKASEKKSSAKKTGTSKKAETAEKKSTATKKASTSKKTEATEKKSTTKKTSTSKKTATSAKKAETAEKKSTSKKTSSSKKAETAEKKPAAKKTASKRNSSKK